MGNTLGHRAYDAYWGVRHWETFSELRTDQQQHWESAAAAVAAEVRREMGWRPIAEAPKDTSILAVDARSGFQRVVIWRGFAWCLNGTEDVFYVPDFFTDWMPLPEPPPQETKA